MENAFTFGVERRKMGSAREGRTVEETGTGPSRNASNVAERASALKPLLKALA